MKSGRAPTSVIVSPRRQGRCVCSGREGCIPVDSSHERYPAQVAGVREILIVSPPDYKGDVHKDVLTAAAILGITRVFRIGGAQAIAALAFGTSTIPAVDVIVGPGSLRGNGEKDGVRHCWH